MTAKIPILPDDGKGWLFGTKTKALRGRIGAVLKLGRQKYKNAVSATDEATIYHIFHVREPKVRYIAYISISQSLLTSL
ncbi:CIC_collapsed_G0004000.mRNA.1.CDS.1 [Saccharomyces cerevisiae]|nr:CIC_collapsed_G0004000.mRNA.1.CDS.1 [Saccharomyces cerevisiae]